jgi:hypothetical protein
MHALKVATAVYHKPIFGIGIKALTLPNLIVSEFKVAITPNSAAPSHARIHHHASAVAETPMRHATETLCPQ